MAREFQGKIELDVRDSVADWDAFRPTAPPTGAPNVLVVLIDDVGFGATSAFGGPCNTPVAERLAGDGVKLTRFHTTALCSPTSRKSAPWLIFPSTTRFSTHYRCSIPLASRPEACCRCSQVPKSSSTLRRCTTA